MHVYKKRGGLFKMDKKLGKVVLGLLVLIMLPVCLFSLFKYNKSEEDGIRQEEAEEAADDGTAAEETMRSFVIETETKEFHLDDDLIEGISGEEDTNATESFYASDSDGYVQEELDTFYSMVSEVVEEIPVEDSTDVLSGKEAIELLNSRGFNGEYVETNCLLNGDYSSNIVLTETTEEKYPIYELWASVYDEKGNGYLWFVAIADDDIMAAPIMDGDGWDFMVSESNIVTSYIQVTNMFYKNVPKRPLIQVDRIDYDTLVELSVQHAS